MLNLIRLNSSAALRQLQFLGYVDLSVRTHTVLIPLFFHEATTSNRENPIVSLLRRRVPSVRDQQFSIQKFPKNDLSTQRSHSKMFSLSALLKSGFTPTVKDFNNFLLLLSRNQRFKAIIHIFSQLSSNKISADAQTHTIFAKALLKENKYEEAVDFLTKFMGHFNIYTKSRLVDSLVQGLCTCNQDPDTGLSLLKDFLKIDGVCPSSRTFRVLICCFSRMGKMDRVIDLLELMSDDKFKYPFDNYVCSSVISGFVRIGEPELAVGFYETAVNSGSLRPNVVTCTSLAMAYGKLRNINKVSDLVAWMESNELGLDVVFYSNWMYGCFREGLFHEAFRKFRAMVNEKVELDIISYTILIDGFSKDGYVEKAVGFLYKMRRDGLEPNLVTYTAVILGFCKKGKLDEAFAILGMLKRLGIEPDEFTYAILIDGVCRKGYFDMAFHLLDEMDKRGVNPSVVTYNTVINGLSKFGRTTEADDFSKGINGDNITYSTLLQGYVEEKNKSGILEIKRRLEAAGMHMDVILCNILIKALLMVGLFENAFAIYKELPQMDLSADSITYCTLIDGFSKAGRVDEAVDVFIKYIEKGLQFDRKIYMMLIEDIFNKKGVEGVSETIHRMEDVEFAAVDILFSDAISFLCKMGFPEAAYSVLSSMRRKTLAPASIGYYSILERLLFEGKKSPARLILTSYLKIYGTSDLRVCKIVVNYLCLHDVRKALFFLSAMNERKLSVTIPITILKTLTNDNRVSDAYELLMGVENNPPDMNVFHYTSIIDALCKTRHISKALDLCTLAKKKGIDLNIVTYNTVINGLCRQGCLVEAFRLFDSLERINLIPTEVTYGMLIDALVKEGLLGDAKMLFERMLLKNLRPGPRIHNSLINGYCKANLLEEAMKLFQDLDVRNIEPDGFTVSALINGYCQKGDMEGALKLFFDCKGNGLLPDFLGFVYLVRGLSAKGRMEESRSILREMLKTQSVVDLINGVKTGVESDSVENLVVLLCERGCISEAVDVLNEVVSVLFSGERNSSHQSEANGSDCCYASTLSDVEKVLMKDFDSFYSLVSSLCMKGKLAEANKLTKMVMEM
ncbi:hypothetical protein OROHE_021648 [Orobanche hederae]